MFTNIFVFVFLIIILVFVALIYSKLNITENYNQGCRKGLFGERKCSNCDFGSCEDKGCHWRRKDIHTDYSCQDS